MRLRSVVLVLFAGAEEGGLADGAEEGDSPLPFDYV